MNAGGLLGAIISLSLRHRVAILGMALILTGFGVMSFGNADFDVFPDFAPPQASIQTEAPGLSSEQVETLVTRPIEASVIGVPGVVSIRSNSIQGLSAVTVIFAPSTDIFRTRQMLSEAMAGIASQLPDGIGTPGLMPMTSSTGLAMIVGMTSKTLNSMDLRSLADWNVKPRLLAIPGISKVSIYGGATKQYRISVDPAHLARFNLSLEDVTAAARRTLGVRGAGVIDNPNQRIVIEANDDAPTISRLQSTVIPRGDGHRLTIGEVATVTATSELPIGAALIDGQPGLQLMISAQYGANTVKVAAAVDKVVGALARELAPDGIAIRADLFRPAGFVDTALGNLSQSLLVGSALVVLVVFLFLWNLRLAVIALTAIPLSLFAGVVAVGQLGYSLNTMTLGGLGIAVGLLVDDAVIVVENVYRRLRQNKLSSSPKLAADVIAEATYEVRSAVVYATLAIALVFVPVLTIQDVAGRLFGPLGLAYILATSASLLVAITVTPVLCSLMLDFGGLPEHEPRVTRWLKNRYRRLLGWVDRRFIAVAALVVGVCAAILSVIPLLGTSFIPQMKEGHYVIQMTLTPGSSLEESTRIGAEITKSLLKVPHIRLVSQRAGRAELADDVFGTHYSEFEVDLAPTDAEGQERTEAAIRDVLQHVPGATFAVKTFLSDRLDEVVSGDTAPVVVRAIGTDLDALDVAAAQIAAAIAAVPGAADVQMKNPVGIPKLAVSLRQDALVRWGTNPVDVLEAIRTAFQGEKVGEVYEGGRVISAAVMLSPEFRTRPEDVSALLMKTSDGTFVPLGELATVSEVSGRYGVLHQEGRRIQTVTASTKSPDVGSFDTQVKKAVKALILPVGVTVEYAGDAEAQSRAANTLLVQSMLAAVGMLLLLQLVVPHVRNLGLVILNLPFAMVGGVVAVLATGGVASLGALVGFVTLFGITLRNAIMMIARYDQIARLDGQPWCTTTAVEGAADRLAPILMTTFATALGLLPLALGSGEPGRELEGPMAMVILGGLFSSALLNLLVLPSLALRLGRFTASPREYQG